MHPGQSSNPSQRSGVQFTNCAAFPHISRSSNNKCDDGLAAWRGRDEDVKNTFEHNSNNIPQEDSHPKQSYVSPFSHHRMDSPFSSTVLSPTPSPQFLYSSIQLPHDISSPPVRSMRSYSEQLHTGSNPIYESMPKSSSHNRRSRQQHHPLARESQESLLVSRQAEEESVRIDSQQVMSQQQQQCCKECTMHHCEQIAMICVNCCEQLCVCCETLHTGENHRIEKGNANCYRASSSLVDSNLQVMNGEIERLLAMHDGLTSSRSELIEVLQQHVHETQRFARVIIESVQRNADLLVSKAQEYSNEVHRKLDNAVLKTRSDLADLIASFRHIEDAKKAIDVAAAADENGTGQFDGFSMYLDLARSTNGVLKKQLGVVSGNRLDVEEEQFKCEKLFLNETRIVSDVFQEISAKINAVYFAKNSDGKRKHDGGNNSPRIFENSRSGAVLLPSQFTSPNRSRAAGDLNPFGVGSSGVSNRSNNNNNNNSDGFKKSGSAGGNGIAFDVVIAKSPRDSHGIASLSSGAMLQVGRIDANRNPMRAKMRLLDEYLKKKIGGVLPAAAAAAERIVMESQCITASTKRKQYRSPGDSRTENENQLGDATTTTDFSQGFDDSNHFNYHLTNSHHKNNNSADSSRLFLTLKHNSNNHHHSSNINNNNKSLQESSRSIGSKNNGNSNNNNHNNNNIIEQQQQQTSQSKQVFSSHDFMQRKKLGGVIIAQSPAGGASVNNGFGAGVQMNSKVETIKSVDDGYSSRSSHRSSSSSDDEDENFGIRRKNLRSKNENKHGFSHSQYQGVLQTRNQLLIPHIQQQYSKQRYQQHEEQSKEISEQEGSESLNVRLHKLLEQRRAANLSNQSSRNNSSSSRSTQIALTSRNTQVPRLLPVSNPFKEKQRQIKLECQQQQQQQQSALLRMRVAKSSGAEIVPQAAISITNAGSAFPPKKTFIGNNSLEGFLEYMNRKTTRRNESFQ